MFNTEGTEGRAQRERTEEGEDRRRPFEAQGEHKACLRQAGRPYRKKKQIPLPRTARDRDDSGGFTAAFRFAEIE
jgi:hypothetical protein